jgi:hypothetical protein
MSHSKSPDNKAFYWAFGVVVAALSVGIVVLAVLVTTSGPRVRNVVVQSLRGDDVASANQALTVVFDRPVESTDFEGAIEIEPHVAHTVSHRNQQLNITFDQTLPSDTHYVLTVKPLLEDEQGKQMATQYTYEFSTAEPSFTYLERNYDPGVVDKIIERAPLPEKSNVMFGADTIKFFARNDKYLAVVLPRADRTDEVRVLDSGTRDERPVDIPGNVQVENLKFSPTNNQFVFIARVVSTPDEPYPRGMGNTHYRYDIDAEQLQALVDSGEEGSIESVSYSRDGQALLYRTSDGQYYLTSATQTADPTQLGKYGDSGGFDRTSTKLTFMSGSDALIYDAQAKEEREVRNIQVGGQISTPMFLHNTDELIYLRDPIGAATLQVHTADADGELEEQVVDTQPPADFFDEPAVSYDDRYVLIEATSEPQGRDRYVGNSQPKDARLVLYDRLDRKVIDSGTIHGIDPVWNR